MAEPCSLVVNPGCVSARSVGGRRSKENCQSDYLSTPPHSPPLTLCHYHPEHVTNTHLNDALYLPTFFLLHSVAKTLLISSAMSSDITFGPPGQEWYYSKTTKTYDLSGGSAKKMMIPTTEGPKETSVTIDPESSALVVVDMQNFFLDPQCMDHPNGLNAVEPTIKVIEKCRDAGIQVYSSSNS